MLKKPMTILALVICASLLALGTVGAFSGWLPAPNAQAMNTLKESGIMKGKGHGGFNPQGSLSVSEGIALLEHAFEVNAEQLGIPKDVNTKKSLTRQAFAHYLFQAILTTGDYAFTEQYIMITDQEQIKDEYSDSIQKLLISQIVTLDNQLKFYPNKPITISEAFEWLHKALQFVQKMQQPDQQPLPSPKPILAPKPSPTPFHGMNLETKAVNDKVNEVIVSAQAPHPGYGLRVTAIQFVDDQAIIHTEAILPDPGNYPQVITKVEATTYIPSDYKPVLAQDKQVSPAKEIIPPDTPVSHTVQ